MGKGIAAKAAQLFADALKKIYPRKVEVIKPEIKKPAMIPFNTIKEFSADINKPSPNYNARNATHLQVIILHATAGSDAGSEAWMTDPKAKVSAHFHIRRNGTIVRHVSDKKRAWHAGVADYNGHKDVNSISLGIEIGNMNDGKEPYPEAQYKAVAKIIKHYRNQGEVDVKSHYDIAPGRKTDPKGFDYKKLWAIYDTL